jgi:hypothetical protein
MTEKSTFWNVGAGDDGPYSADEFAEFISFMYQHDKTIEAVIKYALGELLPSDTGLTINVATGKAIIDGSFFINSTVWSSIVAVPGAGDTNYYNLVLQKDWSSQEIRLVLLGPSIVSTPSITQTSGTIWEISIAEISVTDAGAVTVTDKRVFCAMPMHIITNVIEDKQITSPKIAVGCIDSIKLSAGLFPHTVEGEIACKGLGIGNLQVIPQESAGDILVHRGLSLPPIFSKSIDGCMLSYSGAYTLPAGIAQPVRFDTVNIDNNPWGLSYASVIDPLHPTITIPNGIPDTVYLVFGSLSITTIGNSRVRKLFLLNSTRYMWGTSTITGETEISAVGEGLSNQLVFCIPMLLKGDDVLTLYAFQDIDIGTIGSQHFGIIAIGS